MPARSKKLKTIQRAFGIAKGYSDSDALLRDPEIAAVHINTPIPDHAAQSIRALEAGKHVACTVPMATSIAEGGEGTGSYRDSRQGP